MVGYGVEEKEQIYASGFTIPEPHVRSAEFSMHKNTDL